MNDDKNHGDAGDARWTWRITQISFAELTNHAGGILESQAVAEVSVDAAATKLHFTLWNLSKLSFLINSRHFNLQ